MSLVEDKLQASHDDVASFTKRLTARNFYCTCVKPLNAEYLTVNVIRPKERPLFMNKKLNSFSNKTEVYISCKGDLGAALQHSKEHSTD